MYVKLVILYFQYVRKLTPTHIFFIQIFLIQAKQLKEYEDAVIAKRLEELDEDEVQALMEDVEREKRDEF